MSKFDALLLGVIAAPAIVGLVVLAWGMVRVLAEDDRPYDWEREEA